MNTTLNAPARERITEALLTAGWTVDEADSSEKALRAFQGMGRTLTVFFGGQDWAKPYAYEGQYDGMLDRQGNIPWLVEHVIAFINDSDTVVVQAEFSLMVDGEPMGTYNDAASLGAAVAGAYAAGAVRVEIVRAA